MRKINSPQAAQMADESMYRTLAGQAIAIWPQEVEFFRQYRLPKHPRILDLGCGPGEIAKRVLSEHPTAHLIGIDIEEQHVAAALAACSGFASRSEFRIGDAVATGLPSDSVDLAMCRHVLQAVPDPHRVVEELCRVTRPSGRLHLLAEDYGMIYFHPTQLDCDEFWRKGPMVFADTIGTDLCSGRKIFTMLHERGVSDIRVEYIQVDTQRVPREVFAAIWTAWRDGYAQVISEHSEFSLQKVHAYWDDMIRCIQSPNGYGLWSIPLLSGIVP